MHQVIKAGFAAAAVFMFVSAGMWRPIALVTPPSTEVVAVDQQSGPDWRCAAMPVAAQSSLPSNYMTVNGRVFTLGEALACTARLHTARFS